MSIFSDRTDKARFAEGSILFLAFLALVAAVNMLLFSVASLSLLDASRETLTQFRSDNSPSEDKVIGAVVSPMDRDASPVPTRTKSPSASNADHMSSSTPVPASSGVLTEETSASAALKPIPDSEASATAVETSNALTRAPSADETPPELNPSQRMKASPASIAEDVTTVESSNGSTRAPSADETPPELSPSQGVKASPASIAEDVTAVESSNGSTRAPSADETPPELSPSQGVKASPVSIAQGVTAVETSNGSTRAPSADETPPELSPSQEVKPSLASIVDAANPAQDPSGAPMPILVISHEQRHQQFDDLEMQRPHASLDERSVAFAPQMKESMGIYRSFAGPESKSPVRHTAPLGRGTVKADSIANRLNRAELNRLVRRQGGLALSVAR
jgi:hypothetical protein